MTATLWIVATPIGNLGDLSPRAREILGRVNVIAAEDTRTSRKLVPPRESPPEWISVHEHNEASVVEGLIGRLQAGRDVALVSEAGTPLVSDPGYRLVDAAHAAGIRVVPVPGPCAAVAALSAAGLRSDRFTFCGFLPPRPAARRRRLRELAREPATLIFYVPARDLGKVLEELAAELGPERLAAVARELTKRFETVRRDRLDRLAEWVRGDPDQARGEAVVLVTGVDEAAGTMDSAGPAQALAARLAEELAAELPPARIARILARVLGLDRKSAYRLAESARHSGSDDGSKD